MCHLEKVLEKLGSEGELLMLGQGQLVTSVTEMLKTSSSSLQQD